jgi:predicted GIY-YIG superfamily endonuclease
MFVYVLESEAVAARHYTGLSSDPVARLDWHNAGLSIHTRKFRPWKLLISIEFADTSTATRFERYLKTGSGRAFARRHFGNDQP